MKQIAARVLGLVRAPATVDEHATALRELQIRNQELTDTVTELHGIVADLADQIDRLRARVDDHDDSTDQIAKVVADHVGA